MSTIILSWSLTAAHLMLAFAMIAAFTRILLGPRAQDRVLGLDTFYVNGMLLVLTFAIRTGNDVYFEAALVIALIGFVSTVALSKFLMRGEVIE